MQKIFKYNESERKVLEEIKTSMIIYQIFDKKLHPILVTDGACFLFRMKRNKLVHYLNTNRGGMTHPDDAMRLYNKTKKAIENPQESFKIDYRVKFPGRSSYTMLHITGFSRKLKDGSFLCYLSYYDNSKAFSYIEKLKHPPIISNEDLIKKNIKNLKYSDYSTQLHKAMKIAKFYYWVYDIKTKLVTNGNCYSELISVNQTLTNYPDFLFKMRLIHPSDATKYKIMLNKVLNGAPMAEDNIRVYDVPRKEYVIVHTRLNTVYDNEGKPSKIIGTNESLSTYDEVYRKTKQILNKNGMISWNYKIKDKSYAMESFSFTSPGLVNNFNLIFSALKEGKIKIPDDISSIINGENKYKIVSLKNNNGNIKKFEINYSVINDKYHIPEIIMGIARDVTEYHQKEELNIRKLKEANEAKSDFLSRMSHDMRTPLGAIMSLANFGIEEIDNTTANDYFKKIKHNSEYLIELISDVLEAKNMETNTINIKPQVIKTTKLAKNIHTIVLHRAKEKNIKLNVNLESKKISYHIKADVKRHEQLLINLLSNAIKYTYQGGTVSWSDTVKIENNQLIISSIISDTGVGISETFQQKMFEEFSREENQLSIIEGGTGLGLSIVNKITKALNGTISCKSKIGKGTTFKSIIKYNLPSETEILNYNKSMQINMPKNTAGKKILICEDMEINVMIVKKLLNCFDFEIDVAKNGKIGLDLAKTNKYDTILMDIRMPVMDGLSATKEIRKFDKITPIIALSANSNKEDINKALAIGITDYLGKPILKKELFDKISLYI